MSRCRTIKGLLLGAAVAGVLAFDQKDVFADYHAVLLYPLTKPADDDAAIPQTYPHGDAGGQTVGVEAVTNVSGGQFNRAMMWDAGGTPVHLNPTNLPGAFTGSNVLATDGVHQVGVGAASNGPVALLWSGSAASAINLQPTNLSGFTNSFAAGMGGGYQVGHAYGGNSIFHAIMWSGNAGSAVDFNPTNLPGGPWASEMRGTNGAQQVGEGATSGTFKALLWNGAANTAVNLAPTGLGFTSGSIAVATNGTIQVGSATVGNGPASHALLWHGSAGSAMDLNPTVLRDAANQPYTDSYAVDVNSTMEVGYARTSVTSGRYNAIVWAGTPGSAVNLQNFLPANVQQSYATSIDANGDIFGTAESSTGSYAVEWLPIASTPEPGPAGLAVVGGLALLRRRKALRN